MSFVDKANVSEADEDMFNKQMNRKLEELQRFNDSLHETYNDLNKQINHLINDWRSDTNTEAINWKQRSELHDVLVRMIDICEHAKLEVGKTDAVSPDSRFSTLFPDTKPNRDSGISSNGGSERTSKISDLQDKDDLYSMNVSNVNGRYTITFTSSRTCSKRPQSCDAAMGIVGTRPSVRRGSLFFNNLSRTAEERSITSDEDNTYLSSYHSSSSEFGEMIRKFSITSSEFPRRPSIVSAYTQTETTYTQTDEDITRFEKTTTEELTEPE